MKRGGAIFYLPAEREQADVPLPNDIVLDEDPRSAPALYALPHLFGGKKQLRRTLRNDQRSAKTGKQENGHTLRRGMGRGLGYSTKTPTGKKSRDAENGASYGNLPHLTAPYASWVQWAISGGVKKNGASAKEAEAEKKEVIGQEGGCAARKKRTPERKRPMAIARNIP